MKAIRELCLFSHFLVAIVFVGCTTMNVQKVEPGVVTQGVCYALPKPLLKVTPSSDGTMQAEFIFIPDPENVYAVDAESYFAKHQLVVDLSTNGSLTKLVWKPESTDLMKDVISKSAGVAETITKQRDDARKAEKDAETAKKTKCQAAEDAVKAAQADVRAKERAKEKADEIYQRDQQRLIADPGGDATHTMNLQNAALESKQKADDAAFALNEAKRTLVDAETKRDKVCAGLNMGDEETPKVGALENNPANAGAIVAMPEPLHADKIVELASADSPTKPPPAVPAIPPAVPKPPAKATDPPAVPVPSDGGDGPIPAPAKSSGVTSVYAPMLFEIAEGRIAQSVEDLNHGGRLDVRLLPVFGPSHAAQDKFPTVKVYSQPPSPKTTWSLSGDPLTSADSQDAVVKAREDYEDAERTANLHRSLIS